MSGSFKGLNRRWSTAEQEAYATVASVSRLDYMFFRPDGFRLYTDHKNLIYLFDPARICGTIQRHVAHKVEHWALTLPTFRYELHHIPGD